MISQSAIMDFLARERKDFRFYKRLSADELEERVRRLPIHPPIWRRLRKHQKACFLIGVRRRRFGFFLDTGCGKTLLSIALVRYFWKLYLIDRVLVLVANRTNKDEWAAEIEKHSPNSKYLVLNGSSHEKWLQIEANPDVLFIIETYAGFSRLVGELVKRKKSTKRKLEPDPVKLKLWRKLIQGLILDESTFAKNHAALPYRLCRQITKWTEIAFALTGLPFGREPKDLWAQLHLIDRGESLGETLGLFEGAFYTKRKALNGYGYDKTFKKSLSGTLNEMLAHSTIRYSAKSADLPRVTYIKKVVRLDEDAEAYYDTARDLLRKAGGDPTEIKRAFVRMRQISSGFIGYRNQEDDSKAKFEFDPNAKLESLLATIATIRDKFIVFHEFIPSGDAISRELNRMGVTFVRLGGLTKDTKAVRHAYNNDPRVQGLVMNHAAGGYGLNLQVCKYGLVYESPLSLILRTQIEARFIRQFSAHENVFLVDFISAGTVDKKILSMHKQGKDIMKAVLKGDVEL